MGQYFELDHVPVYGLNNARRCCQHSQWKSVQSSPPGSPRGDFRTGGPFVDGDFILRSSHSALPSNQQAQPLVHCTLIIRQVPHGINKSLFSSTAAHFSARQPCPCPSETEGPTCRPQARRWLMWRCEAVLETGRGGRQTCR